MPGDAALICQIDLIVSFSKPTHQSYAASDVIDSENMPDALLRKTNRSRTVLVERVGALTIVNDDWKYIEPNKGESFNKLPGIETGSSLQPQLYNLKNNIDEKNNLVQKYPGKVKEMEALLLSIKNKN